MLIRQTSILLLLLLKMLCELEDLCRFGFVLGRSEFGTFLVTFPKL